MLSDMVPGSRGNGHRPRLLVVDDDDGVRENLCELLESEGYEVRTAANAGEALDTLARVDIDLLVTDFRMPGPDGLSLIESARGRDKNLRAILMTAFGNGFVEIDSVRRGAVGYLRKPFEADEVTELVARVLALQGE